MAFCSSGGSSVSCRFFARSSLRISTSCDACASSRGSLYQGRSCRTAAESFAQIVSHDALQTGWTRRSGERRRIEHRHDLGEHRLARREARLLVAPERILDRRWPGSGCSRCTGGSARSWPRRKISTRSLLAISGRAMLTASQSPRSSAAAITDAVWKPPVQITGTGDGRLDQARVGQVLPFDLVRLAAPPRSTAGAPARAGS